MKTFVVLARLLTYPTAETAAAVPEMRDILRREAVLSTSTIAALEPLLKRLETDDLMDSQELYVLYFDRSRSLSLNLFEHVHGESRDRGQAMVDLKTLYERHGLVLAGNDLPDFLPLFLEFLSILHPTSACQFLEEPLHIIGALEVRLLERHSDYAPLMTAIMELAGQRPDEEAMAEPLSIPDIDPEDGEALDAVWEEEPVTFGPDTGGGCPKARDLLNRMGPAPSGPGAS